MDSTIKKVDRKLEYLSTDEETLQLIRAREDSEHEKANYISTGIDIGIEKGRADIALNMLKKNLPLDLIIEITGLSEEAIKTISAKLP